jgi:putative phosphonate transport system ATP-binding protein
MTEETLLSARGLALSYGATRALIDVDADLWPGEVLAVVGESGSGKTSLLNVLSGKLRPDAGVVWYRDPEGRLIDVHAMPQPALRALHRSDWGFVHQNPRENLRMSVTAGGNVGERLMAQGARHYGNIRTTAIESRRTSPRIRSNSRACTDTSRLPVGSSMNTRRGCVTSVRAICRRCSMPPEKVVGR